MRAGKYKLALQNLPPAGEGLGCHQAILGVANYGVNAGLGPQRIFDDIRRHVHGSRRVSDKEIWQAIEKAMADKGRIIKYDFKSKKKTGRTKIGF